MYEVRMSTYHDTRLVSMHRTERGAIKAALRYDRSHRRECECGGCAVYVGETQYRVILPDGVPVGGSRADMAYLEAI